MTPKPRGTAAAFQVNFKTVKALVKDKRRAKLLSMLCYKRDAGSETEERFIKRFILSLQHHYSLEQDSFGNIIVRVGEETETLFSCHTDTVHHGAGMQTVLYDPDLDFIYRPPGTVGCLGADDGAGVFIMLEMIKAGVPGIYVFHRAEERGGQGSAHLASAVDWLKGVKRAIAFDRRHTHDVIDSQSYGTCCSDEFAAALAVELNKRFTIGKVWKPTAGVFTDTANYVDTVPECTNLSVGYDNEHTNSESQDVAFLLHLADMCKEIPWKELPVKRDPTEVDDFDWGRHGGSGWWSGRGNRSGSGTRSASGALKLLTYSEACNLIENDPLVAAELIVELRGDRSDVLDALENSGYKNSVLKDVELLLKMDTGEPDEDNSEEKEKDAENVSFLTHEMDNCYKGDAHGKLTYEDVAYWMEQGFTIEQIAAAAKEAGYDEVEDEPADRATG